MGRLLRGVLFFAFLFAFALPARAADPVLMFLLGWAKNIIERQITEELERRERLPPPMPDLAKTYPGTTVEPAIIRRLIDDSFLYLSQGQRDEIFHSFNEALLSPRNAAVRGAMIEHFASRALAVRAAQIRLSQLSYREKEMLAAEFRREIRDIPEADIAPLRKVIEQGLLPMPSDMNQLFLAALDSRPAPAPVATPATAPVAPAVAQRGTPGS